MKTDGFSICKITFQSRDVLLLLNNFDCEKSEKFPLLVAVGARGSLRMYSLPPPHRISHRSTYDYFCNMSVVAHNCFQNIVISHIVLAETVLFLNLEIVANSNSCRNISIFYLITVFP